MEYDSGGIQYFPEENNRVYLVYQNAHEIPKFLYNVLWLKKNTVIIHMVINDYWIKIDQKPIKSYEDFRDVLMQNILTPIQLCYLLFECENYNVYNPGTSIHDFFDMLNLDFNYGDDTIK